MGGCFSAPSYSHTSNVPCLSSDSNSDSDSDFSPTSASAIFLLPRNPSHCGYRYRLGPELGRGEFGITRRCTDTAAAAAGGGGGGRCALACKTISKRKLRSKADAADVRREVEIMRSLPPHPNVVAFRDAFEDKEAVHLIMELCQGGELFDRIVARGRYTERAAAAIMRTIVEVVQHCHKNGVIHRDLKPENFLFANESETSPLKAIDFGLSVFFKPGERFNEIVGSPYYMAPELLQQDYGPEVDIWSAGVILYILLCGVPPFWAETDEGIAEAILHSEIDFEREPWPKVSKNAKDLVYRMLDRNPKTRLTAQEVLEHHWLLNANTVPDIPLGEAVRERLKQFSVMNKFKKKALRVVAEHLPVEEVAGIKQMFHMMDTDKNGNLTLEELKMGLHIIGHHVHDLDINMLMEAADVDGNGTLDCGEFVAVSIHLKKIRSEEHLPKAFSYFDKDGNGYIEIDELREALKDDNLGLNEQAILEIISDVDTDKDGRISYDEFVMMMQAGSDLMNSSRQYSRAMLDTLSINLLKDGSVKKTIFQIGD